MEISSLIENLVQYGVDNLGLCYEDALYARNALLDYFKADHEEKSPEKADIDEVLNGLFEAAKERGRVSDGEEILFETRMLGYVTPSPGYVKQKFESLKAVSKKSATDYLYEISRNNRYIRVADISRNLRWFAEGKKGKIGITINLSKPEKDNKQVLAEKTSKAVKYPKCLLCPENIGFAGTATHPARQTLRIIPVTLNGENWHMQYSPYMYYDEHAIVFCDEHRPMAITSDTFNRLLDFADEFPHYFLGSNADLPIVGGSILAHDHYQGGARVLPMFESGMRKVCSERNGVKISVRDWYNSVVNVSGTDKKAVAEVCTGILGKWRSYSDPSAEILAETEAGKHNTVTPVAMKNGNEYSLDLILRNNRTNEQYPDGIFHAHPEAHNIKKESIGLIEAMGLFILPGRLKREMGQVAALLESDKIDFERVKNDPVLAKHYNMVRKLAANGVDLPTDVAERAVKEYIDNTCLGILENTAVFKNDEKGAAAFDRFLEEIK